MKVTLLDTGPLVAYLSRTDAQHSWAVLQFGALSPPVVTCEPVLTESCHLVERNGGQPVAILRLLARGVLRIGLTVVNESSSLEALMRRYADTPMSLADACLVRLAELYADCQVLTLDSDFRVYRRNGRQMIPVLAPW
jgi:predicted nucleic acid-binding protein